MCLTFSRAATGSFFFFSDAATTEIYTLSLHDALPISSRPLVDRNQPQRRSDFDHRHGDPVSGDRKSTRLNSSHTVSSYAVFCLKKKITSADRILLLKTLLSQPPTTTVSRPPLHQAAAD